MFRPTLIKFFPLLRYYCNIWNMTAHDSTWLYLSNLIQQFSPTILLQRIWSFFKVCYEVRLFITNTDGFVFRYIEYYYWCRFIPSPWNNKKLQSRRWYLPMFGCTFWLFLHSKVNVLQMQIIFETVWCESLLDWLHYYNGVKRQKRHTCLRSHQAKPLIKYISVFASCICPDIITE